MKNDIYKYTKNYAKKSKKIIDKFVPGSLTAIFESNRGKK